jgi:Ca-activated chloride channel family protein
MLRHTNFAGSLIMLFSTSVARVLFVLLVIGFLAPGTHAAGLLAPNDQTLPPLRITDHLVTASVKDNLALTSVRQTFRNDTNQRLEATYIFPLPENADLTGFQMTFNGRMVEGEVLPAEEARQVYERIVRQAKDPGLIEFIGRRLLQMRVFPIEPKSDTTIEVKYQQICAPVSGMQGYHYPLRTRKTAGQAHGAVRFNVELETNAPLKNIWSPTHAVEIVRDGEHKAKIAYEAASASLEDDFLLLYATDNSDLGLSVVAYKPVKDEAGHFVLMLTPRQLWPHEEREAQDVVFIIDTSGSMAGEKIEQARHALKYCVEQLDERDRFNVVRFSTGFDPLWPALEQATKEHRAHAQNTIEKYHAMGGTNIADTLEWVFNNRPSVSKGEAQRSFLVVFLTDGKGNQNVDEIMSRLAQTNVDASTLRVFPFGVGHDVDTKTLDQLANTYQGKPTYVQPGENLELVLGDFFSVVSKPVLSSLHLALPDISVTERFPVTMGDLYHGQQLIIAAKFDKEVTGPVTLTARRGAKQVEYVWPSVAFVNADSARYVPSIWAGRKIAYLVDQIRLNGESEEMVSEVVALSMEYGIQTPYTSWLVAPEQNGRTRFPMQAGAGGGGGGGFGGGGGGAGAVSRPTLGEGRRDAQRERLADAGFADLADVAGATAVSQDELAQLEELSRAVNESAGKAATILADRNARMREADTVDDARLNRNQLAIVKLGGRWYNRIGPFLVDQEFAAETKVTIVKFGSEAYFKLASRKDLRTALAASSAVVVMATKNHAVLVSETEGVAKFSAEDLEQLGLVLRSDK